MDVPKETYADHVILRPPNRLRAKVAQHVDPNERQVDPVRRAEHALKLLENEFDAWMAAEIEEIERARGSLAEPNSVQDFAALYRSAHDLRGQSATLGFPLVGEIADGLCALIETLSPERPPQALIDRHVEAMRAMVREGVRDRDHPLGQALNRRLAELRRQHMPAVAAE